MKKADFWIKKLELKHHPEGGYYKELFKSEELIRKGGLPSRYSSNRSFYTSIYFLLKTGEVSKFH